MRRAFSHGSAKRERLLATGRDLMERLDEDWAAHEQALAEHRGARRSSCMETLPERECDLLMQGLWHKRTPWEPRRDMVRSSFGVSTGSDLSFGIPGSSNSMLAEDFANASLESFLCREAHERRPSAVSPVAGRNLNFGMPNSPGTLPSHIFEAGCQDAYARKGLPGMQRSLSSISTETGSDFSIGMPISPRSPLPREPVSAPVGQVSLPRLQGLAELIFANDHETLIPEQTEISPAASSSAILATTTDQKTKIERSDAFFAAVEQKATVKQVEEILSAMEQLASAKQVEDLKAAMKQKASIEQLYEAKAAVNLPAGE